MKSKLRIGLLLLFIISVGFAGCTPEPSRIGDRMPKKFSIDVMDVDTGDRLAMVRVAGDGALVVSKDGVRYQIGFTPRIDDPNVLQIVLSRAVDTGMEAIDRTGISIDPPTVYTNIPSQIQISVSIWPPPTAVAED